MQYLNIVKKWELNIPQDETIFLFELENGKYYFETININAQQGQYPSEDFGWSLVDLATMETNKDRASMKIRLFADIVTKKDKPYWEARQGYCEPKVKLCNCPMNELMLNGCKCGGK